MGRVRAIWRARYEADPPASTVPALRGLFAEYPEEEVCERLAEYVRVTEARFVDPHRFRATYGEWRPRRPRGAGGLDIEDGEQALARIGL